MREILFRGKNKVTDELITGDLIHNGDQVFISANNCCAEVYPETVGQYTGLKDRNGVKIFEGDIVKYGDTIHRVIFDDRNGSAVFGIMISNVETWAFCSMVPPDRMEVIGNIYDNPELLK